MTDLKVQTGIARNLNLEIPVLLITALLLLPFLNAQTPREA